MPILSQNGFPLPFLNMLSNGQSLSRSQLLLRLAHHFDISQEEAQQMSGSQFTLVSRVAWCDVHFVKAGLVEKRQHHADSMQYTFTITTLGIRELNKRPEKITVGYLQSFYRGKVYRGAGSDDITSDAELALYELLRSCQIRSRCCTPSSGSPARSVPLAVSISSLPIPITVC